MRLETVTTDLATGNWKAIRKPTLPWVSHPTEPPRHSSSLLSLILLRHDSSPRTRCRSNMVSWKHASWSLRLPMVCGLPSGCLATREHGLRAVKSTFWRWDMLTESRTALRRNYIAALATGVFIRMVAIPTMESSLPHLRACRTASSTSLYWSGRPMSSTCISTTLLTLIIAWTSATEVRIHRQATISTSSSICSSTWR